MEAVASTCANLTYIDTLKRTRDCDVECNYLLDGGRIDHLHNTRCQELCPVCYDAIVEVLSNAIVEAISTFLPTSPSLETTTAETGQGVSTETMVLAGLAGLVVGAGLLYLGYRLLKKGRNRLPCDCEALKGLAQAALGRPRSEPEEEQEDEQAIRLFPGVPEDTAEATTPQGATSSAEEHAQPEDLAQPTTPQGAGVPPVEVVDNIKPPKDVLSDNHFR